MEIAELEVGTKHYTRLARRVLAVLSRRAEGWCVYVDAVPGENHDVEWQQVAREGSKQFEPVGRAIAAAAGFDPGDLPYIT